PLTRGSLDREDPYATALHLLAGEAECLERVVALVPGLDRFHFERHCLGIEAAPEVIHRGDALRRAGFGRLAGAWGLQDRDKEEGQDVERHRGAHEVEGVLPMLPMMPERRGRDKDRPRGFVFLPAARALVLLMPGVFS